MKKLLPWSSKDDDFLKNNINDMEMESLCSYLNRTEIAIRNRCARLNIRVKRYLKFHKNLGKTKINHEDNIGKTFGHLTVVGYFREFRENPHIVFIVYKCICSCGNQKNIKSHQIISGHVKSCGCYHKISVKNKHHCWKGIGDIPGELISRIKREAKKRGIEHSVTADHLWEIFKKQNGRCAISGIELIIPQRSKDVTQGTLSLDRIDSSIGYVEGNVQWVHKYVNVMKNTSTEEELYRWCLLVVNNLKRKYNE